MKVIVFETGNGGQVALEFETVQVGAARSDMPSLMRKSAETGRAFLIKNAKSAGAPASILVDEAVLRERMSHTRPRRTLGQLLEALPFRRLGGNPSLEVVSLPSDDLPELELPEIDSEPAPGLPSIWRAGRDASR
jgi:hypothetical protein